MLLYEQMFQVLSRLLEAAERQIWKKTVSSTSEQTLRNHSATKANPQGCVREMRCRFSFTENMNDVSELSFLQIKSRSTDTLIMIYRSAPGRDSKPTLDYCCYTHILYTHARTHLYKHNPQMHTQTSSWRNKNSHRRTHCNYLLDLKHV